MSVRESSHRMDPILIEKMIMALMLVEELQMSGLKFIFKGGTSLALVLGELKRFSIDIDIVAPTIQNLDGCFQAFLNPDKFLRYEVDKRNSNIPKAHYKFFFYSIIQFKESYILLDILFDENPYAKLQKVEIQSPLLMIDDRSVQITCPFPECLLGDKLTAFAPHTTGIQFGKNKELEIVKQLFDVAALYDISESIDLISVTHHRISEKELSYRGLNDLTPRDVLIDSFNTACLIGMRGNSGDSGEYAELMNGVSKLRGFIFTQSFSSDSAILCASKVALLVALILEQRKDMIRFDKRIDLSTWSITNPGYNKLNRLKNINPEAFFFFYQALHSMRLIWA
jgi:hypothetical protein